MNSAYSQQIKDSGRLLMLSNHTMEEYAEKATPKQAAFLLELFSFELAYREDNKRRRLLKRATFPTAKGFSNYDWTEVALPGSITQKDITSCAFVTRKENIICYGPVGTGKTHLAIATGSAACELGMKVRFITASELVLRLVAAREEATLNKVLADFASNDLTIIDEWGYVPIDREGSRLLFQVISRCYESKSLMLTTNLEFSRWGTVLTEEQMATAMIDRLLHHGHVITFSGESYRIRHAIMKMGGKDG
jgi:DNA replication protein DnaC